jgi:thioredoxin-related protein
MSEGKQNKTSSIKTRDSKISERKKRYFLFGLVILVFFVFAVYMNQQSGTVNWIEDYETGIARAKELDKPLFLAFYKANTPFTIDMWRDTYRNPQVIDYLESNFIPVFIDVDKQPELAQKYGINYYPTHYIKYPDREELKGPLIGYDPPAVFIRKTQEILKEMGRTTVQ